MDAGHPVREVIIMDYELIFDLGFLKARRCVSSLRSIQGLENMEDNVWIEIEMFGKIVGTISKNDFGDCFNGICMEHGISCGWGYLINFTNDGLIRDVNLDPIPDDKLAKAYHCWRCGGASRNRTDELLDVGIFDNPFMAASKIAKNLETCRNEMSKAKEKMGYKPMKIEWDE